MNRKTVALLSITLIVLIWGSASAVTKLAVENVTPYVFAFLRNLVASVCLVIFYLLRKKEMRARPPVFKA